MGYKKNRNAIAGRNVESLLQNSIENYPRVIDELKAAFGIEGRFISAMKVGSQLEKCDVKLEFACGRVIDANVKAYKTTRLMFNQTTRMAVDKFASRFGLSDEQENELIELVTAKSATTNRPLIPLSRREYWTGVLEPLAATIIERSISTHKSREVLVLYDRIKSVMRIWKMSDLLKSVGSDVGFTPRGNITLGTSFVLQRKGGNGAVRTQHAKTSILHPGNNIQIKLDIKKFIENHKSEMLVKYVI